MAEKKKINLPEGVTEEMISAWKERYGAAKVKLATLPLDEDGEETMDIIVRVPDRKTLGEFEKWMDKNPVKSKDIMINACVLSGKDQVKTNEDAMVAAFDAVSELIPIRKAVIKNL
ncbi:MAG: hypothetical protein N4A72_21995 [Bacteroidales bacterium]|jgi:hypothetical protein|nr:hypothetical protein [Bacteroidales bacterium]